jgi:predicted chitinase
MLISPPFLPDRANLSEQAWIDMAMAQPDSRLADTQAPEGSFPLSHGMAWHNGLHIQAPRPDGTYLPVRAIADGTVVFVHSPTPPNADASHPLNYNPFNSTDPLQPAWTSDGFVILRHTTEIGAAGATPTQVDYFSVCMHLSSIGHNPRRNAPWKLEDAIYRKEEIGNSGQIYGHGGQIHFEICCDEANLRRFMPHAPAWADPLAPAAPTSDGRTDSVFGSVHVYLPAGTSTSATLPTHHLRTVSRVSGGTSAATDHFLPDMLRQPLWVQITYDQGSAVVSSHDLLGNRIGTTPPDANYEYDLYAKAVQRHDSLDAVSRATSSPSGWYELLRFGRNLGPDPLPSNAAHWREIPTAAGTVWADLNAQGTFKFSDADFPAVMGWNCFDDDQSPTDQRCDSLRLKTLIRDPDANNDRRMERVQLARRLGNAAVRAKLRRAVCRFPSEWERETILQRHGWLLTTNFKSEDDDEAGARKWARFVKHAEAVSFAKLPAEFLKANWRFHPWEFIGLMRKCGWLSLDEIAQLLPRAGVRDAISRWDLARRRAQTTVPYMNLNRIFRKYGLISSNRQTAFLAQIYIETGCFRTVSEDGNGRLNKALPMTEYYAAFYGRGIMQLTWASNYAQYGEFRGFPEHIGNYADPRITSISTHDWAAPKRDKSQALARNTRKWAPRFDPEIVANNAYNACDSGAFFWIKKNFTGQSNINRLADKDITTELIGRMSLLVNGGGFGYDERLQYAAFIERYRGDDVDTSVHGSIAAIRQSISQGRWVTLGKTTTIQMVFTPQRP